MMRFPVRRMFAALFMLALIFAALPRGMAFAEYVPNEVFVSYEEVPEPQEAVAYESLVSIEAAGIAPQEPEDETSDPVEAMKQLGFELSETGASEDGLVTAVVEVPAGTSVEEAIDQLEQIPTVVHAQPNYIYRIVEPTLFESLAENSLVTLAQQANLTSARVPTAWKTAGQKTNKTISVAVIDTGCRLTHEDLVDNLDTAHAWDFWNGVDGVGQTLTSESVAYNGDDNGHGTHVCGIIAAKAENNKGIDGASYNASLIPIKVANSLGEACTSDLVRSINYVRSLKRNAVPNLRVINISMGGDSFDKAMSDAIDYATSEGILVVCSAGNSRNTEPTYPSDYDSVLSVMALNEDGSFAHYNDYNSYKDIAAVGSALSTYNTSNSSYVTLSGTSMAAPLVSGVAALVWSVNPTMSAIQVRDVLLSTAKTVTNADSSSIYNGTQTVNQIDAYDAVMSARNTYGDDGATTTTVPIPQALTSVTYDATIHTCVTAGAGYTLSGTNEAKDAGSYSVTAHLDTGRMWSDNTSEDKTFNWSITKAPLTVTYVSGTVRKGTAWDAVSHAYEYQGFVGRIRPAWCLRTAMSLLQTFPKAPRTTRMPRRAHAGPFSPY